MGSVVLGPALYCWPHHCTVLALLPTVSCGIWSLCQITHHLVHLWSRKELLGFSGGIWVQYAAQAEHWTLQEFRCRVVLFCHLMAARIWDKVGKVHWCGYPCLGAGHQQALQLHSAGSKAGTEREHLTIKRQDSDVHVLTRVKHNPLKVSKQKLVWIKARTVGLWLFLSFL